MDDTPGIQGKRKAEYRPRHHADWCELGVATSWRRGHELEAWPRLAGTSLCPHHGQQHEGGRGFGVGRGPISVLWLRFTVFNPLNLIP